ASAGICACVLGTSPGGALTGSESSEKPQKAGAMNRDVAMRISSPVMSVRRRRDCPAARRHYTLLSRDGAPPSRGAEPGQGNPMGGESHVDADAELDAVIGQHAGVALCHPALHFDGAA